MNTFYSVAATSRKNLLFRHFFSIEEKKSHANLSIFKGGVTIKLGTNSLVGLVAISQGDSKLNILTTYKNIFTRVVRHWHRLDGALNCLI